MGRAIEDRRPNPQQLGGGRGGTHARLTPERAPPRWPTAPPIAPRRRFSGAGRAGLRVCRVKNKFGFAREELVGGYRDRMFCVVYDGPRPVMETHWRGRRGGGRGGRVAGGGR